MAELTAEQFGQLPDFVKGDYEQAGDVYRPVAEGKLSALKGSLNDLDSKYKQANSRIEEIERGKAQEIENAKAEALKTARSKGDVDAIEKRYQEQMADLEKRNGETLKQYEERLKVRDERFVSSERKSIVGDIAKELKILDKSEKLFSKLDTTGQGYIEQAGFTSALENVTSSSDATALFAALDADSDGKLTEQEFSSSLKALSEQLDQQLVRL